jgi:hypothetical protein
MAASAARRRPARGISSRRGSRSPILLRRRWITATARITRKMNMHPSSPRPVVHLELHTGDQARASAFYAKLLCWRRQLIEAGRDSYLALELGGGFGGGIVECGTAPAVAALRRGRSDRRVHRNTRASSAPRCYWRRARAGRMAQCHLNREPTRSGDADRWCPCRPCPGMTRSPLPARRGRARR